MRSKSSLFLLLVLVLGVIAGIVYTRTAYSFGLDINGGVRFTYRLKTEQLKGNEADKPRLIADARSRVIQLLQGRAAGVAGVQEPVVASKGSDQVVVELPGIKDLAEAEAKIGSSARIEFYHARNVRSPQAPFREYISQDSKDPANPTVSFFRASDPSKIIEPGTPEYAQVIRGWGEPILAGQDLRNAEAQGAGDSYQPLINFSSSGAPKMERFSRAYAGKEENIAAVLDNRVISLAYISKDAILRDNAVIQGRFDPNYVKTLVALLNAGALPVDLEKISAENVDPSIGKLALEKMVFAGVIAFAIISVFMVMYYALPGLVATIALALYTLFTLTVLKLFGATFSLAAIAAFILSVGMAVDANILVFERVKEELRRGRSLVAGIELGFRRALPAILDSNACTILTSIVLATIGTGAVKGFAITLIIGVIISLFTAVTVTRSLLMGLLATPFGNNLSLYAVERNWFKGIEKRADENPLRIVERPTKWFVISLLTILIGVPFAFLGGFRFNVEFTGGSEAIFSLANAPSTTGPAVTASLEKAGLRGSNVKLGEGAGGERLAYITVPPSAKLSAAANDTERTNLIAEAAGLSGAPVKGFTEIGPTIQREVQLSALKGVLLSAGLIIVYLAFRFGFGLGGFVAGLRFAISAIGAMFHDMLVVIFLAAVVGYVEGWEISALFLTAMLTIIGFSVHDTIVIFDRIRENLRSPRPDDDLAKLLDRSVTQSFARSINTSGTVVVTLGILVAVGTATPELKFFVLAMLIGIMSGTYSSIYNAAPILYLWDRSVVRRRGAEHGLIGLAKAEVAKSRGVTLTRPTDPAASPDATAPAGTRTYGQVKRRAKEEKKPGWMEID
ncbi:MAG: protein translocase subunit SecD [Armatimonadota bacterium]